MSECVSGADSKGKEEKDKEKLINNLLSSCTKNTNPSQISNDMGLKDLDAQIEGIRCWHCRLNHAQVRRAQDSGWALLHGQRCKVSGRFSSLLMAERRKRRVPRIETFDVSKHA